MTTWFTSDLHFGHKNILNYSDRPWAKDARNPTADETLEMDKFLVQNWNDAVQEDDAVYNLGDLAFCCDYEYALHRVSRLRGQHHFIEGNHDALAARIHAEHPELFASYTRGYLEVTVEEQRMVLCHYALREWHHALRGVWHLFGHTHGMLPAFGKSVDVGVDNAQVISIGAYYRPVSFLELTAFMMDRPIGPHPAFEHFRPIP